MKHLAVIQNEFVKCADEIPSWWKQLSYDEQDAYYHSHPKTKLRPGHFIHLPEDVKVKVRNRKHFQGGLSDELAQSETYKNYVSSERPGGYFGAHNRTDEVDAYVEKRLKSLGLGNNGTVDWLSSVAARHMMDDRPTRSRIKDYTKDAFLDVAVWNHPDHDGSIASTQEIKEKLRNLAAPAVDLEPKLPKHYLPS